MPSVNLPCSRLPRTRDVLSQDNRSGSGRPQLCLCWAGVLESIPPFPLADPLAGARPSLQSCGELREEEEEEEAGGL